MTDAWPRWGPGGRWAGPALAAVLLAFSACAAPPPWQRVWTVWAVDCPDCGAEDRAWLEAGIGRQVVLAPDRFVNPLYEDCATGPDYADILRRPLAQARDYFGPGRLPPLEDPAPLAGQVRCAERRGPPNTVARIVVDGPRAYLLHESGAVLRLR